MTEGAECAGSDDTLADAARKMRDLGVGALPICGVDERLEGVLTDRDIVVRCVAEGATRRRPAIPGSRKESLSPSGLTMRFDQALRTTIEHGVRRLPVIDGDRLVGDGGPGGCGTGDDTRAGR
jgi:CBS domain-containing protein